MICWFEQIQTGYSNNGKAVSADKRFKVFFSVYFGHIASMQVPDIPCLTCLPQITAE